MILQIDYTSNNQLTVVQETPYVYALDIIVLWLCRKQLYIAKNQEKR